MCVKEIGKCMCRGIAKTKTGILSLFGKSADAFNEYEVSLKVTEHGKGANEEPTGTLTCQKKYRVYLGNLVLAVLGVVSVVAITAFIASLFDKD